MVPPLVAPSALPSADTAETGAPPDTASVAHAIHQAHARARLAEAPVLVLLIAGLAAVTAISLGPVAGLSWAAAIGAALVPVLLVARMTLKRGPDRLLIGLSEMLFGISWAGIGLIALWPDAAATPISTLFGTALIGLAINAIMARHLSFAVILGTLPLGIGAALGLQALAGSASWTLGVVMAGATLAFCRLGLDLSGIERSRIEAVEGAEALARRATEARLQADLARWQAERSNSAKSHFLATMSHELRTPLNAILGFAEVLKSELLGPHQVAQYRDYASDIHHSGQHLLTLINELLDLSRIDSGRYELSEEPLHLADIAEDCRRMLEMKAKSKGLTFRLHLAALPPLLCDERAVRQVLINLCSNAITFTEDGGTVDLRVALSADGGQMVSVRDTGMGMSRDDLMAAREARRLGTLSEKRPGQGAGLGLGIVSRLMALHQGRFDIFSREGVGTEAIVTFPVGRVRKAAVAVPLARVG